MIINDIMLPISVLLYFNNKGLIMTKNHLKVTPPYSKKALLATTFLSVLLVSGEGFSAQQQNDPLAASSSSTSSAAAASNPSMSEESKADLLREAQLTYELYSQPSELTGEEKNKIRDEVVSKYESAIKAGSTYAMLHLSQLYAREGNYPEAIKLSEQALAKGDESARGNLVELYKRNGQYTDAILMQKKIGYDDFDKGYYEARLKELEALASKQQATSSGSAAAPAASTSSSAAAPAGSPATAASASASTNPSPPGGPASH